MALRWYVAETKHKAEWLACDQLLRQGFDCFVPTFVSRREILVLFPHYVFVRFDVHEDRWRSVNGTRGVKSLLWGEDPKSLPVGLGEEMYIAGPLRDPTRDMAAMLVGDTVKILSGPWTDQSGRVTWGARGVVSVLLSLLGREIERDFLVENVARVG